MRQPSNCRGQCGRCPGGAPVRDAEAEHFVTGIVSSARGLYRGPSINGKDPRQTTRTGGIDLDYRIGVAAGLGASPTGVAPASHAVWIVPPRNVVHRQEPGGLTRAVKSRVDRASRSCWSAQPIEGKASSVQGIAPQSKSRTSRLSGPGSIASSNSRAR